MEMPSMMYQLRINKKNANSMVELVEAPVAAVSRDTKVATFQTRLQAEYAKSLLELVQAPLWKPELSKYGYAKSNAEPLFCPHNTREFNDAWLRIMTGNARTQVAATLKRKVEMFFIVTDLMTPPPTPWTIIKDDENNHLFIVDACGEPVGANDKVLLQEVQGKYSFKHLLRKHDCQHLTLIDI